MRLRARSLAAVTTLAMLGVTPFLVSRGPAATPARCSVSNPCIPTGYKFEVSPDCGTYCYYDVTHNVAINGAGGDLMAPFGGFKKSGNGREWGDFTFHEFLEVKAVLGYTPKQAAE